MTNVLLETLALMQQYNVWCTKHSSSPVLDQLMNHRHDCVRLLLLCATAPGD
jgi:hypothetical protein